MSQTAPTRRGSALVTGASRGIGAAIARALAADGWPVGIGYQSNGEKAQALVEEIEASGGQAVALGGDITDQAVIDSHFATLEERFGTVLVLVNNAAVTRDNIAPQIDDEGWETVIDTNLTAAFRTCRRAIPQMLRARQGRIINLSSIVGIRANVGQANYAAAKAGLIQMSKTMAVEVARRGVTVNVVAPGFITTDMTSELNPELLKLVPARREGTPEEVAAAVRFLASDDASFVTGATLSVDGGMSA